MAQGSRKEEILEVAAALFSDKGYHATTVRDIAEEAGLLSGSLYAHIRRKEDLLYEIVSRTAEKFIAKLEPIVGAGMSPPEKLRMALRSHVKVAAESLIHARVFLHEWQAVDARRRQKIKKLRDRYEGLWNAVLKEGIESGDFRRVDIKFARLLLLSVANWIYHWYQPTGPLDPEAVADSFMEIIFGGLLDSNKTRRKQKT